jgi:hypothetical protein
MNQMDIVFVDALLCYYLSYWHRSHPARSPRQIILHMVDPHSMREWIQMTPMNTWQRCFISWLLHVSHGHHR